VNATDNALMTEVSSGQVAKLAVLFERHHRGLFRYFVAMTRDPEIAEDLVQDVFFRILRYRAAFDPIQSFSAWMYQIARNAHLDHTQKRRGEVVGIEEFVQRRNEPASPAQGPDETAARRQHLRMLGQALDLLPPDKREILVLSRFQGMKYDAIGQVLGCEVGTVKVRVYRAMRALEQIYYSLVGDRVGRGAARQE
jgi:RNA polymerase sigma-70 factor (ECF subfamily)